LAIRICRSVVVLARGEIVAESAAAALDASLLDLPVV